MQVQRDIPRKSSAPIAKPSSRQVDFSESEREESEYESYGEEEERSPPRRRVEEPEQEYEEDEEEAEEHDDEEEAEVHAASEEEDEVCFLFEEGHLFLGQTFWRKSCCYHPAFLPSPKSRVSYRADPILF